MYIFKKKIVIHILKLASHIWSESVIKKINKFRFIKESH